jgi:hypothetical protein
MWHGADQDIVYSSATTVVMGAAHICLLERRTDTDAEVEADADADAEVPMTI